MLYISRSPGWDPVPQGDPCLKCYPVRRDGTLYHRLTRIKKCYIPVRREGTLFCRLTRVKNMLSRSPGWDPVLYRLTRFINKCWLKGPCSTGWPVLKVLYIPDRREGTLYWRGTGWPGLKGPCSTGWPVLKSVIYYRWWGRWRGQSDEEDEGRQKLLKNNPMWLEIS